MVHLILSKQLIPIASKSQHNTTKQIDKSLGRMWCSRLAVKQCLHQ